MNRSFSECCSSTTGLRQGCQMVCFQNKNPNLGKFGRVLQWKMLLYFMDTWSILWSFVIFYGYLVYLVRGNLVYFSRFGILYQEKSGNIGLRHFQIGHDLPSTRGQKTRLEPHFLRRHPRQICKLGFRSTSILYIHTWVLWVQGTHVGSF
jgi:hypothetical protein